MIANLASLRRLAAARSCSSIFLSLLGIGSSTLAQDDPTTGAATNEAIEEIVVTGSRIVRRDFSSPSPVATIDRNTLQNSGLPTLEAALNQMPQITPAFDRSANNPGDGTAQINLRGLGANRTLVLLNGRRVAPSGVGTAVDVNNLPQVLVDRVEVITGGATTVYGSDAISGVVNFITRDDFSGLALDASAYATEYGDSETYDMNLTFGHEFQNGRGNLTVYGAYYDRQATFASDREFTAVSWVDDWEGNLIPGGSNATPAGVVQYNDGNGTVSVTFTPEGVPVPFNGATDYYNYAPVNYLQIPLQRYSGGLFLNYDLTDKVETYVELSVTRNEVKQNAAPVPASGTFRSNWDNPVLSPETSQLFQDNMVPQASPPWPPNTVAYSLRRRLSDLGFRQLDKTSDYRRLVAGFRGDLGENWDFDVWATYTNGDEEQLLRNDGSRSRLQQGLLVDPATGQCYDPSDGCVPLDLFGEGRLSAEGIAFIRVPPLVNTTSREQSVLSGFVRGSPFASWAGDVQTAFGAEWRRDTGDFAADPALFTGDTLGYSGDAGVDGSESVYEIYAEAVVPLAQDARFADYLALELGARYSDYEHAGTVTTYKIGANWQINDVVLFRSMFQHSVRAPNLYEAFQQQYREEGAYVAFGAYDPCSASSDPVQNGNREKCIATGVPADQVGIFEATPFYPTDFVYGGNPELEPEQADSVTVGTVLSFEAMAAWQVSVDYFDMSVEDAIGDLDPDLVCFDSLNTENLFCDYFTRDPDNYNVSRVYAPKVNRGLLNTKGYDTQVNFQVELPGSLAIASSYADLNVRIFWTHLLSSSLQQFKGGTSWECAGKFGWPCFSGDFGGTYPDDRVTTTLQYDADKLSLNLAWRWMDGTTNAAPYYSPIYGYPDPDLAVPTVPVRNYVDLGVGYRFTDKLSAKLVVSNLLDEGPPMMADTVGGNNTDASMYDVYGRSYMLNVSCQLFD